MALTVDGRELTEAHRIAQAREGAASVLEARQAWSMLDLNDLDGSAGAWMAVQSSLLRKRYMTSRSIASEYIPEYRMAEIGTRDGVIARPLFDDAAAAITLRVAGPIAVKGYIGKGYPPERAYMMARSEVVGRAPEWVLRGGRATIGRTARQDRRVRGYRRVSSGRPCAFCGMIVARGITANDFSNAGFSAHKHCACSAELVYERWEPTEVEESWISSYDEAAAAARAAGEKVTAKTVLPRMRESGLFRDSPVAT